MKPALCYIIKMLLVLNSCLVLVACSDFLNGKNSKSGNQPPAGPQGSTKLDPELQKPNEGSFSTKKMLANIGLNVILPEVNRFSITVSNLNSELSLLCPQLEQNVAGPSASTPAREAWKETMLSFHRLSSLAVGPLANASLKLHDYVYSYPYVMKACNIDQEVIRYHEEGRIDEQLLFNEQGLSPIEYLLFEKDLNTKCRLSSFNRNPQMKAKLEAWNRMPEAARKAQRCEAAMMYGQLLSEKASRLSYEWSPERQNYTAKLVNGSEFKSIKQAINHYTDSLYRVEEVKDERLGVPLTLLKKCDGEILCGPAFMEHPQSDIALDAIAARLRAFRTGFWGHSNPNVKAFALDDYLAEKGRAQIAEQLGIAIDRALESVSRLKAEGPMSVHLAKLNRQQCDLTTSSQRNVELCALFQDMREMVLIYKEVLIELSLDLPPVYQGDGD